MNQIKLVQRNIKMNKFKKLMKFSKMYIVISKNNQKKRKMKLSQNSKRPQT